MTSLNFYNGSMIEILESSERVSRGMGWNITGYFLPCLCKTKFGRKVYEKVRALNFD